jgi:hypothetical protein
MYTEKFHFAISHESMSHFEKYLEQNPETKFLFKKYKISKAEIINFFKTNDILNVETVKPLNLNSNINDVHSLSNQ